MPVVRSKDGEALQALRVGQVVPAEQRGIRVEQQADAACRVPRREQQLNILRLAGWCAAALAAAGQAPGPLPLQLHLAPAAAQGGRRSTGASQAVSCGLRLQQGVHLSEAGGWNAEHSSITACMHALNPAGHHPYSLGALAPRGLQPVDNACCPKVLRPGCMVRHIISMAQENPAHAAQGLQALRQRRRPARHVHQNVALQGGGPRGA